MEFKLDVKGTGGVYVARLTTGPKGDILVGEWNPTNLKNAHKDAEGLAKQYKMEHSPSDVVNYEKFFVV